MAGLGATAYSYMAIVSLLLELDAPSWVAWGLGGFIEIGLVGSALGALHAVMTKRDPALFMTLTWVLSFTTGGMAAWHETLTRPDPAMWVALRLIVPFLAAVFWHVLLSGASHLNAGVNPVTAVLHLLSRTRGSLRLWSKERKAENLMHAVIRAGEDVRAAEAGAAGRTSIPTRGRRPLTLRKLHDRERDARDAALRVLGIEEYRVRYAAWVQDLQATDIERARTSQFGGPVTDDAIEVDTGGADLEREVIDLEVTSQALATSVTRTDRAVTGAQATVEVTPDTAGERPALSGDAVSSASQSGVVLVPRQPAPVTSRPAPPGPRNARSDRHGAAGDTDAADVTDELVPLAATASTHERGTRARELHVSGVDVDVIAAIVGRSRRQVFRYLGGEDTDTPPRGVPAVTVSSADSVTSISAGVDEEIRMPAGVGV